MDEVNLLLSPKEKALQLISIYTFVEPKYLNIGERIMAKSCALIAIDEVLHSCTGSLFNYYQEVQKEVLNYC
jgi:hypothetical protein